MERQNVPGRVDRARWLADIRKRNERVRGRVAEEYGDDATPVLAPFWTVDEDQVFGWRVRLDCGHVADYVTRGDDPAALKGRICLDPEHQATVFRTITEWRDRRLVSDTALWIEGDPALREKLRGEKARWTVTLECGHESDVDMKVDADPASPTYADEQYRKRMASLDTKALDDDPGWAAHGQRMADLGWPQPEPETYCIPCTTAEGETHRAVVAYRPDGWLIPRQAKTAPKKKQPDRAELERRLREAEAEAEVLRAALNDAT